MYRLHLYARIVQYRAIMAERKNRPVLNIHHPRLGEQNEAISSQKLVHYNIVLT